MVYLKRQQSCPVPDQTDGNIVHRHQARRGSSSSLLPMGDHDDCYVPTSPYVGKKKKASTAVSLSPFSLHRVLLPILYVVAMWSYHQSMNSRAQLSSIAQDLQAEVEFHQGRQWETRSLLEEVTNKQMEVQAKYNATRNTGIMLRHELRMKEELSERVHMDVHNRAMLMEQLTHRHTTSAISWMQQRQEALYSKLEILEHYVKEQSRNHVFEHYGPGPHRVEFQVQIDGSNTANKFMVELAPLDVLPHVLATFLDMVTSQIWDHSILYHHAVQQNHVIAAAPVRYGTFETKQHHMEAVGMTGLAFPEYSQDIWQHEEFTLGFAGLGPNFYINTIDNTEHHGPGQQDHHALRHDADPCFGKVIWGKQVLHDMMWSGKTAQGSKSIDSRMGNSGLPVVSWDDYDLTHLIAIRLVQ